MFIKIEDFYNSKLFKKLNNQKEYTYTKTTVSNGSDTDGLESVTTAESKLSAELSDFIVKLNIGELIPLSCGHNGVYNMLEMETYSFYLLNSNFI